jgi:3-deoxy-D-manno-octulosonic-acid transferase
LEKFLYNLSVRSYQGLIKAFAAFNPKAKLWVEGRKDIFKKLKEKLCESTEPLAWFHCASLGEFEQGRPLIERFRKELPGYKILLTFFSPSGYEVRKNYNAADYIFYLPMDSAKNASEFLEITNPKIVFFVKYEFWYHYLSAIKKRNIPFISVSAIFREDQLFFKSYGKFYADLLKSFSHIFVQNKKSSQLLQSIGFSDVTIAGDTRFDRVKEIAAAAKSIPLVEKFIDGNPAFIAGSTWKADMNILTPFINSFDKPLKIIIAPHEIHENEIDDLTKTITKKAIRYSKASMETIGEFDVLVIDNIGMLSSLYCYGSYAYIGGGFGKGIHNTLEAVVNGIPVFFGPNYKKFKEACDLIELGGAFPVNSSNELKDKFVELHRDQEKRSRINSLNRDYIENNSGATDVIINFCKQLLIEAL